MSKSRKFYGSLVCLMLTAAFLVACGDSPTATSSATTAAATTKAATTVAATTAAATTVAATTAPATTVAATTVAATTAPATTVAATTAAATTSSSATTAASGASNDIPAYTGATSLNVPDSIKTQVLSSMGSALKNPQAAAFSTADDGAKVKAFYTDYFSKNGWKDASSFVAGSTGASGLSQIEQAGGFLLVYVKGNEVFFSLGLPAVTASALGFTDPNIPTSGTIVIGFSGEAAGSLESLAGGATPGATTAASAATTAASMTTAAATTAAASATTAASSGSSDVDVPIYPGATEITVPDSVKSSFTSSLSSSVKNPNTGAFVTKDDGATVKSFYTDSLTKAGWRDDTTALGSAGDSITQMGGFFLVFDKGNRAVALIGLPASVASALGVSGSDIPANGTLVLGFTGDTK